jgi:peptide/nickel transport system permease protein
VTVLSLTVLGDGVRTALDPRAASRLRVGTGRKREAKADASAQKATADANASKATAEASAERAAADANADKEAKA